MRIKLHLSCPPLSEVPMNNRYELSAAIYKILANVDSDFSEFLHDRGYGSIKQFKLFTFGNLTAFPYRVAEKSLVCLEGKATLEVRFLIDKAAEQFILGLFKNNALVLYTPGLPKVSFSIDQVELLQEPNFEAGGRFEFRTESGILIGEKNAAQTSEQYLSPQNGANFETIFVQNLLDKAEAYGANLPYSVADVQLKTLSEAKPKGFSFVKKDKAGQPVKMQMKPYLFQFELAAPAELLRIGYLAGFGQDNAMGLGLCQVVVK